MGQVTPFCLFRVVEARHPEVEGENLPSQRTSCGRQEAGNQGLQLLFMLGQSWWKCLDLFDLEAYGCSDGFVLVQQACLNHGVTACSFDKAWIKN